MVQILGRYKVRKDDLIPLCEEALKLIQNFAEFSIRHVDRVCSLRYWNIMVRYDVPDFVINIVHFRGRPKTWTMFFKSESMDVTSAGSKERYFYVYCVGDLKQIVGKLDV